MNNKKSIMAFSGILILIFHLWINISAGVPESFIKQTAYIGVDIFLFISAYSLASHKIDSYWNFVLSRFKHVYLKYVFFSVVGFIFAHWSLPRLIKVILAVELFEKGGGAFLWFLPALMILYVLYPFLESFYKKNPVVCLIVIFACWALVGWLLTYFKLCPHIFILLNRIPIFLLGFVAKKSGLLEKLGDRPGYKIMSGAFLIVSGYYILYFTGFTLKLSSPFVDTFYVCAIPAAIGLVLLLDMIPETNIIRAIGGSTLELYALQMIFGYKLANYILKATKNNRITNFLVILLMLLLATMVSAGLKKLYIYLNNIHYSDK